MTPRISPLKKVLSVAIAGLGLLFSPAKNFAGPQAVGSRGMASFNRGVRRGGLVGTFGQPFFFPLFGGFGGFYSPLYNFSYFPSPYPYLPNYWWTGYYPDADPRQAGYNPSGGYAWDSIGTLLLSTDPRDARVTLDGIFVGTMDRLGPFQLPIGEHTLRVEASGYEPSETVLKVEAPILQQLEVHLNPLGQTPVGPKPAPRR